MCAIIGQIIGAGLSGYGSYLTAKAATQTGKFNARMYNEQARQNMKRARFATEAGEESALTRSLQIRQLVGTGTAATAANGVLIDGTPSSGYNLWKDSQNLQLDIDRQTILDNADIEAWNFLQQAASDRNQARFQKYYARQQATSALISGLATQANTASSMGSSGMGGMS